MDGFKDQHCWSVAEYREWLNTGKTPKRSRERESPNTNGKSRVDYRKVEIDGIEFYKTEGGVYTEFRDDPNVELVEIKPKKPRFTLFESFEFRGKTVRSATYTPDFIIEKDGERTVVEVKSRQTKRFRDWPLRKRLFLKYLKENFPETRFLEIEFDGKKRKETLY